ncbi:MAG: hypothetical protein ACRDNL_02125, partial [Spirillospora sp.]
MASARKAVAVVSVLTAAGTVTGSAAAATAGTDVYAAPGPAPELSASTLGLRYQAADREIERALATARRVRDGDRARA